MLAAVDFPYGSRQLPLAQHCRRALGCDLGRSKLCSKRSQRRVGGCCEWHRDIGQERADGGQDLLRHCFPWGAVQLPHLSCPETLGQLKIVFWHFCRSRLDSGKQECSHAQDRQNHCIAVLACLGYVEILGYPVVFFSVLHKGGWLTGNGS